MGLMNSANTMLQLQRGLGATDHFLHLGDISYADDFYLRPNNTYEGSWDAWQDLMTPLTSAAAYMTLPGNHEVTCTQVTPFLCPKHQQNMTAYRARFRMPSKETGGVDSLSVGVGLRGDTHTYNQKRWVSRSVCPAGCARS